MPSKSAENKKTDEDRSLSVSNVIDQLLPSTGEGEAAVSHVTPEDLAALKFLVKHLEEKEQNQGEVRAEKRPLSPSTDVDPYKIPKLEERRKGSIYFVHGVRKKWNGTRFARCCAFTIPSACNSLAQGTTLYCKAHGGGRRCALESCPRAARGGSDFCANHGQRCEVAGCNLAKINKSTCYKHVTEKLPQL